MNQRILADVYIPQAGEKITLDSIEPMLNDVNDAKGSIHLLKFE